MLEERIQRELLEFTIGHAIETRTNQTRTLYRLCPNTPRTVYVWSPFSASTLETMGCLETRTGRELHPITHLLVKPGRHPGKEIVDMASVSLS